MWWCKPRASPAEDLMRPLLLEPGALGDARGGYEDGQSEEKSGSAYAGSASYGANSSIYSIWWL